MLYVVFCSKCLGCGFTLPALLSSDMHVSGVQWPQVSGGCCLGWRGPWEMAGRSQVLSEASGRVCGEVEEVDLDHHSSCSGTR